MKSLRDISEDERRALSDKFRKYLEKRYGIQITGITRLDRGVLRIDRREGRSWVARIFPADRPIERVLGDAEILQFLEKQGFPAERCASPEPVSSPGGRGVLVTEFVEGTKAEPNEQTLFKLGEMLGRLNTFPTRSAGVIREAGSLHRYSKLEGGIRNELDAALSWLDTIEGKVPAQSRILYDSLRKQIKVADDCNDLPKALIHPDPVLKNVIVTPDSGPILIDWTGAGRGPRIMPIAILAWSGALRDGSWSPERVDAAVKGYSTHVHLQENELLHLVGAMKVLPLIFACWRFRYAIASGKSPDGTEWWWPREELTEAIAARARAAFESPVRNIS